MSSSCLPVAEEGELVYRVCEAQAECPGISAVALVVATVVLTTGRNPRRMVREEGDDSLCDLRDYRDTPDDAVLAAAAFWGLRDAERGRGWPNPDKRRALYRLLARMHALQELTNDLQLVAADSLPPGRYHQHSVLIAMCRHAQGLAVGSVE